MKVQSDPLHPFDTTAGPGKRFPLVTKADADLPGGPCRALLVGTGGTANLMDLDGTVETAVPLQQGYNPLQCRQVRTGGSATDIRAIY